MATLTYTKADQTRWKEKRPTDLSRLFGERSLSDAVKFLSIGLRIHASLRVRRADERRRRDTAVDGRAAGSVSCFFPISLPASYTATHPRHCERSEAIHIAAC